MLANDVDVDDEPLLVTEIDGTAILVGTPVTLASGAIVSLNGDGTLGYDPNGSFAGILENVLDVFEYRVSDGTVSSTADVEITITPSNAAPVANGDTGGTDEDTLWVVPPLGVMANDTDVDAHDVIGTTVTVTSFDAVSVMGAAVVVTRGRWLYLRSDRRHGHPGAG